MNNQSNVKNQHGVIPTERSDEGSLTAYRDDNLQTQRLMNSTTPVAGAPVLPSGDNYRLIPRRAARVLTPEQLYTYFVLTTYTDFHTHRSEVLEDTLASQVGVKQGAISKYIGAMEREGFISVTRTYSGHKKKNHYYVPAPTKDFIIVDVSLRDEDWAPLTVKEQASAKGWLLMFKSLCLNNCNDTLYSINQMHTLVKIGRDKAQSLMRLLMEKDFAAPLEERFTGYRILGPWFDKGNTYQFPKGTPKYLRDIYNDLLRWCHKRGFECPPYRKEDISMIAGIGWATPEERRLHKDDPDFMARYDLPTVLTARLPHMTAAPQSLAYFVKVLMNKPVDTAKPETHTFVL